MIVKSMLEDTRDGNLIEVPLPDGEVSANDAFKYPDIFTIVIDRTERDNTPIIKSELPRCYLIIGVTTVIQIDYIHLDLIGECQKDPLTGALPKERHILTINHKTNNAKINHLLRN